MLEFPSIITDGDLELVKLDPTFENTQKVFELIDRNREYLGKWLDWIEFVQKPEDYFNTIQEMSKITSPDFFIRTDNKIVGVAGFFKVKEADKRAEMGYWLGAEYTGHGIMTRVVRMLEKLAFADLGLNRIVIRMNTKNERSAAIPKRLNYHFEGEMREDMILKDGSFRNTYIFSKLKSEWEKENKNA